MTIIKRLLCVHTARGKVLSGPGKTITDICVVKPDTSEGQWEETVRAQGPTTGPSGRYASWASRGAKQGLLVACTGAPRSCLSPAPGSSMHNLTFPGAPSINTPHWRESSISQEETRGGAGGRAFPHQGVYARVASQDPQELAAWQRFPKVTCWQPDQKQN